MTYDQAVMVHRLEETLSDIRKIAGWKGVELGNMLGLSRQAISTLEKQKSRLTLAQYIAIRHLLDAWVTQHPENKALARVIPLVLDDRRIFGKPYEDLRHTISSIAAAASGGASQSVVNVLAKTFLDEWEGPARKYCNEQLKKDLVKVAIRVSADMEPRDWTEQILEWRNQNGKKGNEGNS